MKGDPLSHALSPQLRMEGNFPVRFFRRKSIGFQTPYRLTSSFFLRYVRGISTIIFNTTGHSRACMVGFMGRISHTNLKNRTMISEIATSKNHIELLDPGQIWDKICDPTKILVYLLVGRDNLRHYRNQKKLVGHKGCMSKRTVVQQSVAKNYWDIT
jgi:hypothetical protein